MVIETLIKHQVLIACANNQVIGSWLDKVENFERMRLDLIGFDDVPHVETVREYDHTAANPVVVDQELAILKSVDLHVVVEELVLVRLQGVEVLLERGFVEGCILPGGEASGLPWVCLTKDGSH